MHGYYMGIEEVNGTVIGGFTRPYQFWTAKPDQVTGKRRKLGEGHFEDDAEAEGWIKQRYPAEYARGIEMRCFDVAP